jgi:hypothetical protein
MATPLGHYLFGLAIAESAGSDAAEEKRGLWLALIAWVPDLDIIPGLLVGRVGQFQRSDS